VNAVASRRARTNRAAALHRHAAAVAEAAAYALDRVPEHNEDAEQRELAKHLRAVVPKLAPGWLGAPLDSLDEQVEGTGQYRPAFVRIGTARPVDDATFPVIVPLLGTGHLAFDADARDQRVAGALRALLLRLVAATPPGSLLVRVVDAVTGTTFAAFSPLAEAGLMPPPVTDRDGLRTVLAEAEGWVRPERSPGRSTRNRTLLLVVASLPQLTEAGDLHRIAALAQAGPAAGLHLVVAGWPPPPLTTQTAQQPLPLSTQVWLRNPYALVGDPPGASLGESTNGLGESWPVYLDEDPPAGVVVAVCREIARQAAANHRLTLGDVLPDPAEEIWGSTSAEGLATTVGVAGDLPVMLRFNDQTPHWMVGGRSGSGKTAFLINILYGLSMRYGPDELALYLLDFKEGVSFADFTPSRRDPSWLPQARAVGVESDREYGLAVLRELDAEMTRRAEAYKAAGVTRFVDLRAGGHAHLPRVLCVIDEFQVLLAGTDRIATEAVGLLESVARKGRSYGIHLVLCSQTIRGVESLYAKRDSIFGQFPVRVALPGGGDVLEPTNYSAAALPLGTAVVNTAGGLGGPRGATRGHEKLVQFPDPHADQELLSELRLQLWRRRPIEVDPPVVFEGYAYHHLADDPAFQSLKPGGGRGGRREMLVGRTIDVRLSTATFPVDTTPGRHLAVLGPSEMGADVVDAAARSLAAQHEPGTVSFLVASLVVAANPVARRLVADLRAAGHPTTTTDAARLAQDLDPTRPGYLVAFGMEAAGGPPYDRFRALVRDGPTHGAHLVGWWRGLSRFTEQTGGSAGREDVAGLVFLNLPPGDVDLLVGQPMQWRPRPNRALCYDRHTGRAAVIVPFARAVS
jgi:DNA segregation ATPase FtsK/SpoIIIE, S-DNA-T family